MNIKFEIAAEQPTEIIPVRPAQTPETYIPLEMQGITIEDGFVGPRQGYDDPQIQNFVQTKNLIPNEFDAKFVGFEEKQAESMKNIVNVLGFYNGSIRTFVKGENQRTANGGQVLGHFNYRSGEYNLRKITLEDPRHTASTIAHEAAHAGSALTNEDAAKYYIQQKGLEVYEETIEAIKDATAQFIETRVFLNGYQEMLQKQMQAGAISYEHYLEEVNAILAETRLTDPRKLEIVNERHMLELTKLGYKASEVVNLIDVSNKQLHLMMDGLNSHEHQDVEAHLAKVKKEVQGHLEAYYAEETRISGKTYVVPELGIEQSTSDTEVNLDNIYQILKVLINQMRNKNVDWNLIFQVQDILKQMPESAQKDAIKIFLEKNLSI